MQRAAAAAVEPAGAPQNLCQRAAGSAPRAMMWPWLRCVVASWSRASSAAMIGAPVAS